MFWRAKTRRKDGKAHRCWSVVENRRVKGGRVVQRQLLHLGELNDYQRTRWVQTIEVLEGGGERNRQLALFADDREELPALPGEIVRVRLSDIQLRRPRQGGACWPALCLWDQLRLDEFWQPRLPASRKGTRWLNVLKALAVYGLVDPRSEFRFHRDWYRTTALSDLLGEDFALAQKDTPNRCLDRLVPPLSGPVGSTSGRVVPGAVCCSALRSDELLFRERSAGPGRREQTSLWPQSGSSSRLHTGAGGAGGHPGRAGGGV